MNKYQEIYERLSISNLKITDLDTYNDIIDKTPFLDNIKKVTHRQRLWHIINNQYTIPVCKVCERNVKWQAKNRGYPDYCAGRCGGTSESAKQKRKDTCNKKYGVSSFSKTSKFKNREINHDQVAARKKREHTCMAIYGSSSYLGSAEGKDNIKNVIVEKYGVDNVRKSPIIISKIKDTIQTKYGVSHYNNTQQFRDNMALLYANPQYTKKCIDKRLTTMIETYGHTSIHMLKPTILSKFHTNNIPIIKYNESMLEREISEFLSQYVEIERNDRRVISPKELDIYIPSKNIAIEINGIFLHSEAAGKDKHYHLNKTIECSKLDIQLIHIFEDDWNDNKILIKRMLLHKIGMGDDSRYYARNCLIKKITTNEKREFLDKYHIQGNGPSSYNCGLFHNGELVGVQCFIMNSDRTCYLNRYATSGRVVGGFSKLLKYFIHNNPSITKITSFADREISDGSLYEATGFKLDAILPPDYKYIINGKRIHKFNFRKSKLIKIFDDYDETLSESDIMKQHNISRIWGVGLLRYVYYPRQ